MSTVLTQATTSELDDFVNLSAILTGIAVSMLKPLLDTHGTAQTYLDIAKQKGGATFAQLMAVYDANRTQPPANIGTIILEQSGDTVAYMAKSIMLLWYLACWYDPQELAAYRADPTKGARFTVVSSDAYTQGWVWRVGQTHPMGYSTLSFGYWHQPPQPLSAFIGGGNSK